MQHFTVMIRVRLVPVVIAGIVPGDFFKGFETILYFLPEILHFAHQKRFLHVRNGDCLLLGFR